MVAINPGSLSSHTRWSQEFGFQFPICVDPDKKVAAAYGSLKGEGGVQRSVVVVDKQGRVRWVQAGMPETGEILSALDTL